MTVLRTLDSCFINVPDYDYEPHYLDIDDPDLGTMRLHYLDEGPRGGQIILCIGPGRI